jgi:hypothetical protein
LDNAGVPIVASDIAGNIGLLGEDHPGLYKVQVLYDERSTFYEYVRVPVRWLMRKIIRVRSNESAWNLLISV